MFTKGMRVTTKDVSASDEKYHGGGASRCGIVVDYPVTYELEGYPNIKEWVWVRLDYPILCEDTARQKYNWLIKPEELIPLED